MNDYISGIHHHGAHQGEYVTHHDHPVTIDAVHGARILDSRGYPTVRVSLELDDGRTVTGDAPAGASTGAHEAVELRDGGSAFGGRDVTQALHLIDTDISGLLTGRSWSAIGQIDAALAELDGTTGYRRLGANSVVATSIAASRALAHAADLPLWQWIAEITGSTPRMPVPHFNVLNGGAHADSGVDVQEFMIAPIGAPSFREALRWGTEVYHALKTVLQEKGLSTGLGDEGGFAPSLESNRAALDLIAEAVTKAGYRLGEDIALALDVASSEFFDKGSYTFEGQQRSAEEMAAYYTELVDNYPIVSIEDPLDEDDWDGWQHLTAQLGDRVQLVGDDLFVTNVERLQRGIDEKAGNALLVKVNQIGSLTETFDAISLAQRHMFHCMISHRSGETEDTFIADLAVATNAGQIKTGAPARSDRVAKYNQLLRIEEDLDDAAVYAGRSAFPRFRG